MGSDQTQLSEPYPVSDQYADGVGKIEATGHNLRMVLFTKRERDEGDVDREIVGRIVMPVDAIIPAIQAILRMPVFRDQDISALLNCLAEARDGRLH